MKRSFFSVKFLCQGALIAALYTALTLCVSPISSGPIQCRISEALCVLPWFTPAAVPGLFIGCFLSNLLLGAPALDLFLGSLATLLAALCTRKFSLLHVSPFLAPLPSVIVNAVIVGYVVQTLYSPEIPYLLCALYVGAGQLVACYGLGLILLLVLRKKSIF